MNKKEEKQIEKHNKLKVERELKLLKEMEDNINNNLDEMEENIIEILDKYDDVSAEWDYKELTKYNRLNKMNEEIEEEIKEKKRKEYTMVIAFLTLNAKNNIKDMSTLTNKKINISPKEINEIIQEPWSGLTILERHNKNTMNLILKIKEQVNLPLMRKQGELKTRKILADIQDTAIKLKGNIRKEVTIRKISREIKKNARSSFQLADTENTHIAYSIVDKVGEKGETILLYNAILDDVTCEECSSYQGKRFSYGFEPLLPRHPNCRCFYTVIEE